MEAEEAQVSQIKDPYQFYEFCEKHMKLPHSHIFAKEKRAVPCAAAIFTLHR